MYTDDLTVQEQLNQVLGRSLEQQLTEAAKSRWARESHAEEIARLRRAIELCERELRRLQGLTGAKLREECVRELNELRVNLKARNQLAMGPYAYLTEQLDRAQQILDAMEDGSPLKPVVEATIDDIKAARNVWERQPIPRSKRPEDYRQEAIAQLKREIRHLQASLAYYEPLQRAHEEGAANLRLLADLLESLPPEQLQ